MAWFWMLRTASRACSVRRWAASVSRIIAAGDHFLVLVDVEAAEVNSNCPLLY